MFVLQATSAPDALFEFLDEHKVCGKQLHVAHVGGAGDGLTMVISRENLHNEAQVRQGLSVKFGDSVQLIDGIGAVSVIGAGINTSYKNFRAGSAALAPIKILGVSTSSFRITWLLPVGEVEVAVRSLHATFLEKPAPPVP